MTGRTGIAGAGLLATMALCAASSTAGAQTNEWSVQSNGGFVSLDLLNMLRFAGGGSEADAGKAALLVIGGRRIASLARSFNPTNRRRGGP